MKTTINLARLSDKHIEVLKHMLAGEPIKEIAHLVGLKPTTIYHYVNKVFLVCECPTKTYEELRIKFK